MKRSEGRTEASRQLTIECEGGRWLVGGKVEKKQLPRLIQTHRVVIGGILRHHPNRDQRAKEVCHRCLSEEEGGSGSEDYRVPNIGTRV